MALDQNFVLFHSIVYSQIGIIGKALEQGFIIA